MPSKIQKKARCYSPAPSFLPISYFFALRRWSRLALRCAAFFLCVGNWIPFHLLSLLKLILSVPSVPSVPSVSGERYRDVAKWLGIVESDNRELRRLLFES
jgi:hypothetical protein